MGISDFDQQYAGFGIPAIGPNTPNDSGLDSGAVAVSTTPHTMTLTVGTNADGTQPTVIRGQIVICLSGLNASAVLGAVDIQVSDGTHTEYVDSIPATGSATAGQGATYFRPVFISRLTCTTIKTIAVITNTTGNNNYTKECRFLCERD